jgi:plastocyanin
VAAVLGVAAGVVPSLAVGASPPSHASFTAVDPYSWQASGGGNQVTIAQGGTVSFGYPSGGTQHNADFYTSAQPSSCTQTAGPNSGSVPPLPHSPTSPGWAGTCTFNTPGTYRFYCGAHLTLMPGTIVVEAPGGTTTTTTPTTTTPTTTTTSPTTTTTNAPPPPVAGRAAVSVRHRQHGRKIVGSVEIPAGYAGGSLEVDVLAPARSLGLRRKGLVRVGRLTRQQVGEGTLPFSVTLRGLHRHHRLTLTVKVRLRAPQGPSSSLRFTVLLRR